MQINRLFEMIYLLLDRRRMTAKELAERFEVSERTVYRDVEVLSAAGIPVYATKGRGGGIQLLDDFVLDKSVLSEREKNEILFSLQGMSAAHYPEIDEVLNRLSSLFQQGSTAWIDVDFTQWGSDEGEKKKFFLLRDAILSRKRVRMCYCSAYGIQSSRTVEPVKLRFKGKAWYLQAYCCKRQEYRMFKLFRISDLVVTDELFEPKQLPSWENEKPSFSQVELKLRFSPTIFYRVYEEFDRSWILQDEDGSLLVSASFPMDEWVYGYLLSFGEELEVLEPEPVRETLKKKIQQLHQLYF